MSPTRFDLPRRAANTEKVFAGLLLALAISAPARAAEITYKIQRIFKLGDQVAGIDTKPSANGILLEGLNDRGHILFATFTVANPNGIALLRFADGGFTAIVAPERDGPRGVWPKDLVNWAPDSMNQAGNVVFTALSWNGGNPIDRGTFLWEAETGTTSAIMVPGMPAPGNLTIRSGWFSPVINNQGEIALPVFGRDAQNRSWAGIFLRGTDRNLHRIVLTDEMMPDGRKLTDIVQPSLNDAGAVAFLGTANRTDYSAYLWEKGTITPVALDGMDAPEGGKIRDVLAALLNNQNPSVLVLATRTVGGPLGLYRFADGKLTAVAVPGNTMPDGGKLSNIVLRNYGVSNANELGQHAFLARLEDGSTAAYLLQPDGTLSLILKSGQVTDLGMITLIGLSTPPPGELLFRGGWGVGLNRQGQVALNVRIDNGPMTLVLLTPDPAKPGAGN
jgi:hypothetical protein